MYMPSTLPGEIPQAIPQRDFPRTTAMQPWLDGIDTGVAWLDADLQVEYCNQRFRQLLADGGVQLRPGPLLPQLGLRASTVEAATRELQGGRSWKKLLRREERALKLVLNPLPPTPPGQTALAGCRYSIVLDDYSGDLRLLQHMAEARHHAERTDKAKSQFLAHMSHELRTPLNAILGFTQLLQVSTGLNSEQLDNLGEINTAGTYLLTLINEILDLGSVEAGKISLNREAVAMTQLLSACIALMEPLAAVRHIRLYQEGGNCLLHTDHVRLKQIVLNLLGNAIKYNCEDGEVRLCCFTGKGKRMRLEVQDSGPGIKPEQLASIFNPFERLGTEHSMIEGTGIGLMITRRLVRLMQGDIGVVSIPGRGSVFWVEFPQDPDPQLDALLDAAPSLARQRAEHAPRQIIYLGADAPLLDCLRQVSALRPGLELLHCDDTATLPALPESDTLLLVDPHTAPLQAPTLNLLKRCGATVVMVSGEHADPAAAEPGQACIPATIRLPALLALLDAQYRPEPP